MAMTSDHLDVVRPANSVPGTQQGYWTYSHYAVLPDDGHRYEIVDGVLYMAPSPNGSHQDAVGRFYYYLLSCIEFAGLGKVRMAPFDVVLQPNVVVQPDVLVVLQRHLHKVNDAHILGAPDLVIEVASPSTATHDRQKKYIAYERARVPEYWIADASAQTVEVLTLENNAYYSQGVFRGSATLPSKVVPQIAFVQVERFFA